MVRCAADGRAAVDALGAAPADVVLMDLTMSVMDGWQATGCIRAEHPDPPPAIALTGHRATAIAARAAAAGFARVLAKPVRCAELVDAVCAVAQGGPETARVEAHIMGPGPREELTTC